MVEQYLTYQEVADLCRVHVDTVGDWARARKLPVVVFGEKNKRIPASALAAYAAAHTRPATHPLPRSLRTAPAASAYGPYTVYAGEDER